MPRTLFSIVLATALFTGRATAGPAIDADVREAIIESVRARMGAQAVVEVGDLSVRGVGFGDETRVRVRAVPDAGSRVGGPIRFLLVAADGGRATRRLGSVDTTVRVSVPHVRVVRPVARGAVIDAADLAAAVDDVGRVALLRLPARDEVIGAAARRDLAAGALVLRHSIAAAPLVRSGDEVTTIVRLGAAEVRGRAISAETAAHGEIVRVVTNKKQLRGRVVGAGEVEIQR